MLILFLPISQRQSAPVSVRERHPKHHNFPDCTQTLNGEKHTESQKSGVRKTVSERLEVNINYRRVFLKPRVLMIMFWILNSLGGQGAIETQYHPAFVY